MSRLPFKYSYKVTDTFYAGEYPYEIRPKDGIPKLNSLLDFGIKTIIDLTDEPLTQYAGHLPGTCVRFHYPTRDYTSPDFSRLNEIHEKIDESEKLGEKIYVHCKGGHDRTGVVVATYFVHLGFSPELSKQKLYGVFVPPVRGRYDHTPLIETKWDILDEYREWLKYESIRRKAALHGSKNLIKVIEEPEYFIEEALCPYCKQATLGVTKIPRDREHNLYTFICLNKNCLSKQKYTSCGELDRTVRQALNQE